MATLTAGVGLPSASADLKRALSIAEAIARLDGRTTATLADVFVGAAAASTSLQEAPPVFGGAFRTALDVASALGIGPALLGAASTAAEAASSVGLDTDARRALAAADTLRARRDASVIRLYDVVVAGLTTRTAAAERLLERGAFGQAVLQTEATRCSVLATTTPWMVPTEAFVIPSAPGTTLDGGIVEALRSTFSGEWAEFEAAARGSLGEGVTPDRPASLRAPPGLPLPASWLFVATAASSASGAVEAILEVCRRAATEKLVSITVPLLGTGKSGLAAVDVALAVVRAIEQAAPFRPLRYVVLTTSDEQVPAVVAGGLAAGRAVRKPVVAESDAPASGALHDPDMVAAIASVRRGVVRVEVDGKMVGTGFIVGPNLVLTANEVLGSAGKVARAAVVYRSQSGPIRSELDPTSLRTDENRNVTAVRVRNVGDDFPAPIRLDARRPKEGEPVGLVQYGEGGVDHLTFGTVRRLDGQRLLYAVPAVAGSAGAPLLDATGAAVAIHLRRVVGPERDLMQGTTTASIISWLDGLTPPETERPESAPPHRQQQPPPRPPERSTDTATPWLRIHGDTVQVLLDGQRVFEQTWTFGETPLRLDGRDVGVDEARQLLTSLSRTGTEEIGDALARLVFGAVAPSVVLEALRVPAGRQRRVVLDLDRRAASLPWEYLRVNGAFLLEERISLVRHVPTRHVAKPLRLPSGDRRILFAWANPDSRNYEKFDVADHLTAITAAKPPEGWSFIALPRATPQALRRTLESRHDVFHYLGHGDLPADDDALLVLHGEPGTGEKVDYVTAVQLASWLGDARASLVVLGACHSGAVPSDARFHGLAWQIVAATGIPVVAMQVAVPQEFSTAFVADLYQMLATNQLDVERAVYKARRIPSRARSAFGIPVLYADARAADAVPELEALSGAKFSEVTVAVDTATAEAAIEKFTHRLPDTVRRAVAEAFDGLRATSAPMRVAPPPDDVGDVRALATAVEDVLAAAKIPKEKRDEVAMEMEKLASAPAPRPPRPTLRGWTEPLGDRALERSWGGLAAAFAAVRQTLSLPDGLLETLAGELLAGRHVLLAGPVGTGKTSLAVALSRAMEFEPFNATASSDWTPFEVVGGFWPQGVREEGGGTRLELAFRAGCVTEAVLSNWEEAPAPEGRTAWRRRATGGTWLILDELNRADMDRAMGPLFTALETRRLRVPVLVEQPGDPVTTEIPIPSDFRILATLNGVDRHYLFRLSDALKRRFAWIEVPVTPDWVREWELVGGGLDEAVARVIRQFVYMARLFVPVGTAQIKAAAGFLRASQGSSLSDEARVSQALLGSVVPSLEETPPDVHRVLAAWARKEDATKLVPEAARTLRTLEKGVDPQEALRGPIASLAAVGEADLPIDAATVPAHQAGLEHALALPLARLARRDLGSLPALERALAERGRV